MKPARPLDDRLKCVAEQLIEGRQRQPCQLAHVDIGCDHGYLLAWLIATGNVDAGIAIENKTAPLQMAQRTLAGLNVQVRLANGLDGLATDEADSLSISGMGGRTICKILAAHPERLPPVVVLQPNDHLDLVRRWAYENGLPIIAETVVPGGRYQVMRFETQSDHRRDTAYDSLDLETAFLLGPCLLRHRPESAIKMWQQQHDHLAGLPKRTPASQHRLDALKSALNR